MLETLCSSHPYIAFAALVAWGVCAILGTHILTQTLPEFYAKFHPVERATILPIVYALVGPFTLLWALIILCIYRRHQRRQEIEKFLDEDCEFGDKDAGSWV